MAEFDVADAKTKLRQGRIPLTDHIIANLHYANEQDFLLLYYPGQYKTWLGGDGRVDEEDAGDRQYGGPPISEEHLEHDSEAG